MTNERFDNLQRPFKLLLSVLFLLLILLPAARAKDCLTGSLSADRYQLNVTLTVKSNQLPHLDMDHWSAVATTKQGDAYAYTLGLQKNILPVGREYPLVIRLGPTRTLINLRKLLKPSNEGDDRLCPNIVDVRGDVDIPLQEGYAYLEAGRWDRLVATQTDSRVPKKLADAYLSIVDGARDFYESLLGKESHPVASVVFITDSQGDRSNGCDFSGSSLPGLLLIGLRSGCMDENVVISKGLLHFVAHETFHQWNFGVGDFARPSPDEAVRMMLLEGGAELAADFFLSKHDKRPVENYLAPQLEDCLEGQASSEVSVSESIVKGDSSSAYTCGAVYVFLRSSSLSGDPLLGFQQLWKQLIAAPKMANVSDAKIDRAFYERSNFRQSLSLELSESNYELRNARGPNASQRFRIATDLMREVLRNDCNGRYGLYTGNGVLMIDPDLQGCRSIIRGKKPESIGGKDIYLDPLTAREAWLSSCKSQGTVDFRYSDDKAVSKVTCTSEPRGQAYVPLELIRSP